jgi:hypothetical protein
MKNKHGYRSGALLFNTISQKFYLITPPPTEFQTIEEDYVFGYRSGDNKIIVLGKNETITELLQTKKWIYFTIIPKRS